MPKTGGVSFSAQIHRTSAPEDCYPPPGPNSTVLAQYLSVPKLIGLDAEERSRPQIFSGHFPVSVVDELGEDLLTISILRDPVRRAVSTLRHIQAHHPRWRGASLEDLYENERVRSTLVDNHQVKIFSMGCNVETIEDDYPLSSSDLDMAKRNVETVDFLGISAEMPALLATMRDECGWNVQGNPRANASPKRDSPSDSLLERIRSNNSMDIDLFEHAKGVLHPRRPARSSKGSKMAATMGRLAGAREAVMTLLRRCTRP